MAKGDGQAGQTTTAGGSQGNGGSNMNNANNNNNNANRQGGRGRFNHKNKNNNNQKNNNGNKKTGDSKIKFEGRCADLKGHFFDCSVPMQAGRYMTTKQEIVEYIGHMYKYGNDTKRP